jgi:predicted AAA+ superfamily ATPase
MIINHLMDDRSEPLPRLLGPTLVDRLRRSPVVVLTGARQTGKTTLVRSFDGSGERAFATLDSLTTLDRARREPEWLAASARRLTLDEVQRAPDLLLAVKHEVDRNRAAGRFLLTGSANLLLLRHVSESLAGRTVHLVLRPMTEAEKHERTDRPSWPRLLAAHTPAQALGALADPIALDWREAALRGGLPAAALAQDAEQRALWLEGYLETYVQRDVRDLARIADLPAFARLVRLSALRNGALLNLADLGRDAAVPRATAERWLSLLQVSFLVTLLPAFARSASKRLIKAPKLYALDTGLGLHLANVATSEQLLALPNAGAWLENLVLNDILAWAETEARKPQVCFYRNATGEEIDLVIEHARQLLPVEVKASRSVRAADARALDSFCEEHGACAPFGVLVYDGLESFRLTRRVVAVSLAALM